MGRPIGSGAKNLPACPDPAHAGSRVALNGRYGRAPHQRQRFRCFPEDAGAHNFAGALAHQVVAPGEVCGHCEQAIAPYQGQLVPRTFEVPVSEIAQALVLVGQGMSYTEVGRRCRQRLGRNLSRHTLAQMVASWVEAFTPVVAARHAVTEWPTRVILDSTSFTGNLPGGGRGKIFWVYAVCAWDTTTKRSWVVSLVPRPTEDAETWAQFLVTRPNQPEAVVSDKAKVFEAAFPEAWPSTVWRLCRWHLRHGDKALNYQLRFAGIDLNVEHPITSRAERAFWDLEHWEDFRAAVEEHGTVDLSVWAANQDAWLRAEFAAQLRGRPYSTGAAENALAVVRETIEDRAFCYRNLARTELMLELLRLRLNAVDDELTYAHDIREFLRQGGRPAPALSLRDKVGHPSLRPLSDAEKFAKRKAEREAKQAQATPSA